MNTTIKLDRVLNLKTALHLISSDSADIRYIQPILTQRGTHVFTLANLNDLAVYFIEVHVTVNDDQSGELVLFWTNGIVKNVVSAIEKLIED